MNRASLPKDAPLRLGLIGAGLVVFQTAAFLWIQPDSFWRPANFALSAAAWVVGAGCFIFAMAARIPPRAQWLALAALIGSLWGAAYLSHQNYSPVVTSRTDNEMIGEYAAEALRRGYNPYTWNFADITRVYRDRSVLVPTLLDGSTQNRVTYPALPTLLLAAFGAAGPGQARTVSLVFHTLLIVLLFVGTPTRVRPLAVLSLFVVREFIPLTLGGAQDVGWSALLVAMLLAWKRPTLRAALFGLACAYRQQAWFVAPFLLIHLWNESTDFADERRTINSICANLRILYFLAVSLGVFLAVNLPFMLWDFRAWMLGVFEPAYAAFNVYSQGLGALSQYNLLPLPRVFYTVLQLSSFFLMLVVHWRHPRLVGAAFWVFPAIFFWLYYRGLANYWLYWIPPLVVALTRYKWRPQPQFDARRRQTANLIALTAAANLALAAILVGRRPAITASLFFPLETADDRAVARLGLVVANNTGRVLRPRFAVQRGGAQPLPWEIDDGPLSLQPGESGRYVIRAIAASRAFSAAEGAQVVVTDASSDYTLRAVIDVPGDPTFTSPDLIVNPSFTFWSPYGRGPAGWTWSPPEGEYAPVRIELMDGQTAVILPARNGAARLGQTITFPDSFSIQVRPTSAAADPLQSAYGLEFDDSVHRLWVLFGDAETRGVIDEDFGFVYLRAPLNEWSEQTIDPAALYEQFGWELPPYSTRSRQGIEFAARQVTLNLLVSGTDAIGVFGGIEQDAYFSSPRALVDEALANPDVYYANLGDEYCRQRNDDLAAQAYRRALEYNASSVAAQRGLERCK